MNPVTSSPGSPYISPLIILLLYTLHCSQIKLLSGSQTCSPLSCPQAFLFCKTHLSLPHLITLLTPIEFSAQLSLPLPLPQPAWANWLFQFSPAPKLPCSVLPVETVSACLFSQSVSIPDFESITDSMEMSLRRLWELVMDNEGLACCASWCRERLDWATELNWT